MNKRRFYSVISLSKLIRDARRALETHTVLAAIDATLVALQKFERSNASENDENHESHENQPSVVRRKVLVTEGVSHLVILESLELHDAASNEHKPTLLTNDTAQPNHSAAGDEGNHGSLINSFTQSAGSTSPETLFNATSK